MAWQSPFIIGEAVPWFECASPVNPNFAFSTLGGRRVVLSFLGNPNDPEIASVFQFVQDNRQRFGNQSPFFAVITEPAAQTYEAMRYFHDYEGKVSALYKAADGKGYHRHTLVLDPALRVAAIIPFTNAEEHNKSLATAIGQMNRTPPITHAPVLVVPRIFEPEFCRELIAHYHEHGGDESGYMREVEGKTVPVLNQGFKRRRDFNFGEGEAYNTLRKKVAEQLNRNLLPEIFRVFQFRVTRIERYIVAHYSHVDQGFFGAHRDNTTPGTAHRRFACTINLNAEEFEGGELRFPEFGPATYRAPTGGAVIFSCSLMHEATPVTKGERYAFLPFFYNEETAELRRSSKETIASEILRESPASTT